MPRVRAAALLAALVLGLAGCGGGEEPAADRVPESESYNDADLDFAEAMIPHHAQALSMVDVARGRPVTPAFSSLMEDVSLAQAPEVEELSALLRDWDRPVPETERDHVNAGHGGDAPEAEVDDGHHDLPGMHSHEDLEALTEHRGPAFERAWLTMMLEHHEGAIELASTAARDGEDPEAVALAERIERTQRDQAARMETLLGRLSG